jgi:sulfhydrogenase subunit beta (sulfur reductase)
MLVTKRDFNNFLLQLSENPGNFDNVIVSQTADNNSGLFLKKLKKETEQKINLTSYRTTNPLKYFFYPARERVYPETQLIPKNIIAGVKACDLKAIEILDKALLNGNFTDPSYSQLRKNTLLISADCEEISKTCHCNLVEGKPFADSGFDLNLSSVDGNYKIQIGSGKGKEFLKLMKEEIECRESSPKDEKAVAENRIQVQNALFEENKKFNRKENYSGFREVDPEAWKDESRNCIGCGACTNICPTCYCLILNDESKYNSENFVKVRSYDSCQWCGYARVAGGGTPRPKVHQRFRNRYLCKFDYMKSNFDQIGCTGCGRCIEVCADFRQVVQNISIKAEQIT